MAAWLETALVAALIASTASAAPHRTRTNDDLQVNTTSGLVNGAINSTYPAVRQFYGIPFAQPPLDKLRFMPPQPLTGPSETPIDGTQLPLACSQVAPGYGVYTVDADQFSNAANITEDCLTLTVWTPTADKCAENTEDDKDGLPVLIWIYGGGFQTGSTNVPYQIPLEWIQDTQSHIVVSIQYRLNIFGFPDAVGLETQNPGLLDQRAAVEWLRDNIGAFGGDKDRMVLWGQSAGAASVDVYNFAHPTDPIISGQICDSGSAFIGLSTSSTSNFSYVASQVGCPSTLSGADPASELACMQTIPESTLIDFQETYNNSASPLAFNPFADNVTVFSNYSDRYALGAGKGVATIPAIFGTNNNEGVSLIPYPADPATMGPNQTQADGTTLSAFLCPAAMSTTLREQAGLTTYRYLYKGNFSDVSPRFWEGPYHSSELPQIFGTRGEYRGPAGAFEVATSKAMQERWVSFARDPSRAEGWVESTWDEINIYGQGSPDGEDAVVIGDLGEVQAVCQGVSFGLPG